MDSDVNHNTQKKAAVINDFTSFGRCSLAVTIPILSAMKVQCCPVPTAFFTNHTGFDSFAWTDNTSHLDDYIAEWRKLNLRFNAIQTGFLGSHEQVDFVLRFLAAFRTPETTVCVDPVMGDYGKLYKSYTPEMCKGMKRLLAVADLITPNLTEACELLDVPYPKDGHVSFDTLEYMAAELSERGPSQVVITGLGTPDGHAIRNFIYEAERGSVLEVPKIGHDRSGTGDAFAGIVAASLIKGEPLESSVKKAATFISKCLLYAEELELPWNYGLPFEEYLTELK